MDTFLRGVKPVADDARVVLLSFSVWALVHPRNLALVEALVLAFSF
jgi:hypothetical protein